MIDEPTDLPTSLENAKTTLKEALWVGWQDSFAQDVERLSAILNVRLDAVHSNVTSKRPSPGEEDPRIITRLHELNGFDLELWRWAEEELRPATRPPGRRQVAAPR